MKRTIFTTASVFLLSCMFLACPATNDDSDNGDMDEIWLDDLKNPFIGHWESKIPSTDYATVTFEFKEDGTFTCEFPAGPDTTMTATGGYLVKDNVQVSFMSYDEGIGGYTFEVVDNDTISVTEIDDVNEATGEYTSGNTAHFTRVVGSVVNKENKPFALANTLIRGIWKETATPYQAEYTYKADGTGAMSYTANGQPVSSGLAYSVFHDAGIDKDVLITFMTETKTFAAYAFEQTEDADTISVQEITGVTMGQEGPSATYDSAVQFTRSFTLADWAGTWNAIDQYLDNEAFDPVWTDAAAAIKEAEPTAEVDAATLKQMFAAMLKTDFKSCVIEGNRMTIYDSPNATGSATAAITYTYDSIHTVTSEEGSQDWFRFTGNTDGQFKYLVLGPAHRDDPDAMLHFHLQYSGTSFDAATENANWVATVTPSTTTVAKIAEDLAAFPWAMYAPMFVPTE